MCFSSCMFTREVCNKEMVQCLKQICPRCMPANSMSMCKVYDSMAVRVADALSVFSCYACCLNINKPNSNNTMMQNGQTIKPPSANGGNSMSQTNSAGAAASATTRAPQNGAGNINNGNKPVNAVNQNKPTNAGVQTKPANTGNQNKPTNAGNQNKPTNAGNQNKPTNGNNLGGVVPGNGNIAYLLLLVRGNKSCASGTCPFWEKHGRSFAALRCYQQQYQECTCLHRMCFSSCMFTREVCNKEMVQCLKQICPRCMPANSMSMCKVYDSMAVRVADALSVFSCYACCPNINKPNSNNTMMQNGQTIKPPSANGGNSMSQTNSAGAAASATTRAPQNGAGNINNGNKPVNAVNQNKPTNAGIQTKPANTGNQNKPTNAGNQNKPTNAGNQNKPTNGKEIL
ncbi:unnamed protein product [Adineta steineri]|uniref:Uncharacterized protein n=1 Tax=Adineta steineri TaxID=433720 RepID=A0A815AQL2_9BILA|nr:unnamed protein product [Adineta steineri]